MEPAGFLQNRLSANSQIFRRRFAAAFRLFVAHLRALIEAAQAGSLYGRDVHKHVLAAVVGLNKSVPLSRVKPLHCTRCHVRTPLLEHGDNLRSIAGRTARTKPPSGPGGFASRILTDQDDAEMLASQSVTVTAVRGRPSARSLLELGGGEIALGRDQSRYRLATGAAFAAGPLDRTSVVNGNTPVSRHPQSRMACLKRAIAGTGTSLVAQDCS